MDPALSRLRIAEGSRDDCASDGQPGVRFCPDNELFERLVSELGVSMAPPINFPARGVGPRGFLLALDTTLTTVDAGGDHWLRGSEGDGTDPEDMLNASPSQMLVWNRVEMRKGLPFGFEVGSSLARAIDTSLWSFGLHARWALFEGFHSGLGQLPDIAVGASYQRSLGSHQLTLALLSFDVVISKPFVLERAWEVSPLIGVQTLLLDAESGEIDLTPGSLQQAGGDPVPEDAFASCQPEPGSQIGDDPAVIRCANGGGEGDFVNNRSFQSVSHTRVRLSFGGRARFDFFTFGLALMVDVATPEVVADVAEPDRGSELTRQVAINVSLGAIL